MDMHTRDYKKIANYTGLCLCIFLVAFFILNVMSAMTSVFGGLAGEDIDYTVLSVAQMISYLASFIIPAVILRAMLKRASLAPVQRLEFRSCSTALFVLQITQKATSTNCCFALCAAISPWMQRSRLTHPAAVRWQIWWVASGSAAIRMSIVPVL